jgi:uncharacterized protein YjiK
MKIEQMRHIFWFLVLILSVSCRSQSQPSPYANFIYDLTNPVSKVKLKKELDEISALSPTQTDSLVAAVQDEKGKIYIVNAYTGDILGEYKFEGKGDYEGIEIVDSVAYVLRSDGMIIQVNRYWDSTLTVEKFRAQINQFCDAEGLAYSPADNSLIVACKHLENKQTKSFWAIDLTMRKVNPAPRLVLDLDMLSEYTRAHSWNTQEKLLLTLEEGNIFPSGLAIHPSTGDWYILSSANKRLVILSAEGQLKYVIPLYQSDFMQPEGIAFGTREELIIANEGRDGKANILIFNPRIVEAGN